MMYQHIFKLGTEAHVSEPTLLNWLQYKEYCYLDSYDMELEFIGTKGV